MTHRLARFAGLTSLALLTAASGCHAQGAQACGQRAVSFLHVSSNGRELIAGVQDMSRDCSEVVGVDFASGRIAWRVPGMMTSAHSALSRDGSRLAISYAGKTALGSTPFVVLDAGSGRIVTRLHDDRANGLVLTGGDAVAVTMSPDGKEVYAALRNGWLAAWDADTGASLFTQDPPEGSGTGGGNGLSLSPDGKTIAWSRDGGVYLLKLPPERAGGRDTVATVAGHIPGRDLHDVTFSPDGHLLAMVQGAVPGNTLVWSVTPFRALPPVTGCGGQIAWSPDKKSLACQTNNAVQLVSLEAPRRVLQSLPRTALDTPLTPIAAGGSILLYQQRSPSSGSLPPLMLSTFGSQATRTFAFQ